jgi:hypothetical protein
MKSTKSLLTGLLMMLGGCSSAHIDDYAGRKPELDLRHYLNGDIEAVGVLMDRSGMVTEQFKVTLKGKWKGNDGTLEEHFVFSSGKKEARIWTAHFTDDNHFTATAHDVVGKAEGAQFGNAVNMRYTLRVPVKDSTYDIAMDDWMYLMDDHTIINHTQMSKFGVKVGELILTFRKKQ